MKWQLLAAVLAIGCASPRGIPDYDGGTLAPETTADSTTFIPVTIHNHRSRDVANPPSFFLTPGRHALGVVSGSEDRTTMIDVSWLPSDGCVQIVAHYVGLGDLMYDQFCVRRGDVIDISLDEPFNSTSAWSHK